MMGADFNTIKGWVQHMYDDPHTTHVIIVCDTFDNEDYPVYVKDHEDVYEVRDEFDGVNMQKIMEIYNRNLTLEEQMAERRAYHP